MSALRFAVYRDRSPFEPTYLGEVLAVDRDAAVRDGEKTFGGAVVAMRASGSAAKAPTPELERALAKVERSATRRNRPGARAYQRRGRAATPDQGDTT